MDKKIMKMKMKSKKVQLQLKVTLFLGLSLCSSFSLPMADQLRDTYTFLTDTKTGMYILAAGAVCGVAACGMVYHKRMVSRIDSLDKKYMQALNRIETNYNNNVRENENTLSGQEKAIACNARNIEDKFLDLAVSVNQQIEAAITQRMSGLTIFITHLLNQQNKQLTDSKEENDKLWKKIKKEEACRIQITLQNAEIEQEIQNLKNMAQQTLESINNQLKKLALFLKQIKNVNHDFQYATKASEKLFKKIEQFNQQTKDSENSLELSSAMVSAHHKMAAEVPNLSMFDIILKKLRELSNSHTTHSPTPKLLALEFDNSKNDSESSNVINSDDESEQITEIFDSAELDENSQHEKQSVQFSKAASGANGRIKKGLNRATMIMKNDGKS